MREIKFRGKSKETGEWIYGGIAFGGEEFNNTVYITNPKYDGEQVYWMYEVNPETVGQYTGIKDEDRQEIYEGDMVEFTYASINFTRRVVGTVKFKKGAYYVFFHQRQRLLRECNEIKVIGNEKENPEVLNK